MLTLTVQEDKQELIKEILRLKEQRNAVILAHNYQIPEIQDLADFVGDSLRLSQEAARTKADIIAFCGVHFMAETASIISPEKTVLIPDPEAGCSLAAQIDAEQLRAWKAKHPGAVVVSYVNTTAEVKAESDYCCTSSNAVKIVNAIPRNKEILFLPDMFLGAYVESVTGRKLQIWPGECHVHAAIRPEHIISAREKYPNSEFLVHPECGCTSSIQYMMSQGDACVDDAQILSTEGMIRRAKESPASTFVVATETGILHRLRRQNPEKRFEPVFEGAVCQYMKMITLEKLHRSLEEMVYEVKVPEDIASRARIAIERMLQVT